MMVRCVCGWTTVGDEDAVVAETRRHGAELHNMDVSRDEVLAMVIDDDIDEG